MTTSSFYRRIVEFQEVISNQVTATLAENSNNLPREKMIEMSREVSATISRGFDSMITSLQGIEKKELEKNTKTKKTRGRKKN